MGTRNLTCVVLDGGYKIAQYGQWDGYPGGQGVTALEFARSLSDPKTLERFKGKARAVKPLDTEKYSAFCASIGVKDGWCNMEQGAKIDAEYPLLSRDHGAGILSKVLESADGAELNDSVSFAGDSLLCEWAYVIDLDAGSFEAFRGFNKEPLDKSERFADAPRKESSAYHPVRLIRKWALSDLPSKGFV